METLEQVLAQRGLEDFTFALWLPFLTWARIRKTGDEVERTIRYTGVTPSLDAGLGKGPTFRTEVPQSLLAVSYQGCCGHSGMVQR